MAFRRTIIIPLLALTLTACSPGRVAEFLSVTHGVSHSGSAAQVVVPATRLTKGKKPPIVIKPNPFLGLLASIHNDPFLSCTRAHESDTAGSYTAYNPAGPWYGAYQFTQSTWNNSAVHAGVPQFSGANVLQVPGPVQDWVAFSLYHWQGNSPWGGRC